MKNITTGAGLAIVGLGLALHPVLSNVLAASPSANAAPPASLVTSAVAAQAGPTVVWYGLSQAAAAALTGNGSGQIHEDIGVLARAWSDGRVEALTFGVACGAVGLCSGWVTLNDPGSGYKAAADINADERVDGADLASVLSKWGDAPRMPFPPTECPLNLINP